MNSSQPQAVATWPLVRALGGVGTVCALLIVVTWQVTLPTILAKKAVYLESAVYRVLPGASSLRCLTLSAGKLVTAERESTDPDLAIYAGYDKHGDLMGLAFTAHGAGFQDIVRLLYGYDPVSQEVIGFEVLESKETPGLGDKIEKDATFQLNFKALDVAVGEAGLKNPIELVPPGSKNNPWEIDSISGATISSRAVATILGADTSQRLPLIQPQYRSFMKGSP